jgi:nitric oxide reductase activation protein
MAQNPLSNLSYRNPLNFEGDQSPSGSKDTQEQPVPPLLKETAAPQQSAEDLPNKHIPESASRSGHPPKQEEGAYYYDEWDVVSGDYKPRWCRLEEKSLTALTPEVVDRIKGEYGAIILLLRRYFEYLRPQAFKKIKKQEFGEEIDLESAIESHVERMAGCSPSDRVYTLRQKKSRDVTVAFLIDMSGSTSQQIETLQMSAATPSKTGSFPKRVIDIEREGMILLGEALEAIGDEFAMYGFSGHSRAQVNFHKIKEFDEPYGEPVRQRIGAIEPQGQNRDGTAIRHGVAKLLARPARIKLLILLSDGKPLDEDYKGVHALEDTRMALREARAQGIHPFCITVDRHASEYIHEMYDQVSYTIISHILTLPQRLPRIYKQLTT